MCGAENCCDACICLYGSNRLFVPPSTVFVLRSRNVIAHVKVRLGIAFVAAGSAAASLVDWAGLRIGRAYCYATPLPESGFSDPHGFIPKGNPVETQVISRIALRELAPIRAARQPPCVHRREGRLYPLEHGKTFSLLPRWPLRQRWKFRATPCRIRAQPRPVR